jgi:hypothetical protein
MSDRQFSTITDDVSSHPPKYVLIEWITPSGQIVRGKWLGGIVWMPEGSSTYVYYQPISWRIV